MAKLVTLLLKTTDKDQEDPVEKIVYAVFSKVHLSNKGRLSNLIISKKFNTADYLIRNKIIHDITIPLTIVNENHTPEEVLSTMYDESKKIAELRANLDHNKLLDLTGNVEISEEDKKYL